MADNFTITVNQPNPTANGAAKDTTGGATTRSFLVVGWFDADETISNDLAGWPLSIDANWENLTFDALSFPITKPDRRVDHYAVYFQLDTSFTLGSVANKIGAGNVTTTAETQTTIEIVISAMGTDGTATFAAAYNTFDTNDGQVQDFKGQPRLNATRAAGGKVQKKSYANDLTFDLLDVLFTPIAMDGSDWRTLLLWLKFVVPLTLEDNSTNKFIASYNGSMFSMLEPGSENKNSELDFPTIFIVESEVLA